MVVVLEEAGNEGVKIVATDSDVEGVLSRRTRDIEPDEMALAHEIAHLLKEAIKPYLPAAGLAAPQIGISRSIFIYSFDRDPKNLEVIINPSFIPLSKECVEGWEGCLSVLINKKAWKLAYLPRYENIQVTYTSLLGQMVVKNLEGFAAKVFQHEFDHLQGIVNIFHPQAVVKVFDSKEELMSFLAEVKKQDASSYKKPA